MVEATVTRPAPPPWPPKGTPEYTERIAKMRAGHAARVQKAAQTKQQRPTAAPAEEPVLIDVGEPKAARMAPEPREKPKAKAKGSRKGSDTSELEEPKVREYMAMFCRWAASHEGHEHWQRDDDELEMVSRPATNCYNRLDAELREKLTAISDPAALVFGVVCIFGPSIVQEFRSAKVPRPQQQPRASHQQRPVQQQQPRASHQQRPVQQQPQGETEPGFAGGYFPGASPIQANGAAPTAPVPDISATGI